MSHILKMLFLCAILHENIPVSFETLYVPVEIEGGGTVNVDAQNDHDLNQCRLVLNDGEKGRIQFSFEEEGTWTYTLYQPEGKESGVDDTVYILTISCAEQGKVESVTLYEKGSDRKTAAAIWHNRTHKHSPDTADSAAARIYALISCISLCIAAVLFRVSKGEDDET